MTQTTEPSVPLDQAVAILNKAARRIDRVYQTIVQLRKSGIEEDTEPPKQREMFTIERDAVTTRDSIAQLALLLEGKDLDEEQPAFTHAPSADYAQSFDLIPGDGDGIMPLMPHGEGQTEEDLTEPEPQMVGTKDKRKKKEIIADYEAKIEDLLKYRTKYIDAQELLSEEMDERRLREASIYAHLRRVEALIGAHIKDPDVRENMVSEIHKGLSFIRGDEG